MAMVLSVKNIELSENEQSAFSHHLRVAADQYDRDAEMAQESIKDGGRLQRTFQAQAASARAWADKIDNCSTVRLIGVEEF